MTTAPTEELIRGDPTITPPSWGAALARDAGGRYLSLADTAHTLGRKPIPINLALRDFAAEIDKEKPMPDPTAHRPDDGRKRALYISSPIGLGHAQRDVAIA